MPSNVFSITNEKAGDYRVSFALILPPRWVDTGQTPNLTSWILWMN
jgi:hypothetical protein